MNKVSFKETIKDSSSKSLVVIRRIWENANSAKSQYSLQLAQRIPVPGDPKRPNNRLVAIAQGIAGAGTNIVTAIFSVSKEFAESKGLSIGDYQDGDAFLANDVFGCEVNIEVTESFSSNPYSSKHQPKINPSTGQTLMLHGKPIYRHTELVDGEAQNQFLNSEKSVVVRQYPRGLLVEESAEVTSTVGAYAGEGLE